MTTRYQTTETGYLVIKDLQTKSATIDTVTTSNKVDFNTGYVYPTAGGVAVAARHESQPDQVIADFTYDGASIPNIEDVQSIQFENTGKLQWIYVTAPQWDSGTSTYTYNVASWLSGGRQLIDVRITVDDPSTNRRLFLDDAVPFIDGSNVIHLTELVHNTYSNVHFLLLVST